MHIKNIIILKNKFFLGLKNYGNVNKPKERQRKTEK